MGMWTVPRRDVKNTTQPSSGKDSKKSQENTKKE